MLIGWQLIEAVRAVSVLGRVQQAIDDRRRPRCLDAELAKKLVVFAPLFIAVCPADVQLADLRAIALLRGGGLRWREWHRVDGRLNFDRDRGIDHGHRIGNDRCGHWLLRLLVRLWLRCTAIAGDERE